jgi:hypothetical protein
LSILEDFGDATCPVASLGAARLRRDLYFVGEMVVDADIITYRPVGFERNGYDE